MNSSANRLSRVPKTWKYFAFLLATLAMTACSFRVGGSAKTGGDAKGSASGESKSKASANSSLNSSGSAKGSGNSKASASGNSKASASGNKKSSSGLKFSASSKIIFKSKKRSTSVGRAKAGGKFNSTFLVRGGASGKASGSAKGSASGSAKGSGSANGNGSANGGGKGSGKDKNDSGSAQSGSQSRDKDSGSAQVDSSKRDKDSGSAQVDSGKRDKPTKTPVEPKPPVQEPVVVIEPPAEPPDNVFGYEEPVRGCFEGVVYPLAPNTEKLPTNWADLTGISVVYACEWDIPTREWSTGFPGVADRFEWFTIRYTGAFNVDKAGDWKFRISSDDGTKLFIDGKLVVDNDGTHPPKVQEGSVKLSAGDHDMVLEYFQGPRYHINLQLYATPPGGEEGIFSVR